MKAATTDDLVEDRTDAMRQALAALRTMRERLQEQDPVAVVGMACRFPGGSDDPSAFWSLLEESQEAIVALPAGRWDAAMFEDPDPDAPGKMYSSRAGYLTFPVDGFDAAFFGISGHEANAMDPQQRLLLEVAWEALERSGIAPDRLNGSPTGVFVGLSSYDYVHVGWEALGIGKIGPHTGTGTLFSIASGRLSFALGLQGPSMTIDTACSSSLVAVHQAIRSLRRRECRMAIAGGANLILSPLSTITLCKIRALSPSERCRSFDAAADGYVRGEGCGVLVLKRLSDAIADGDTVLAVLKGSAVNHGGRSGGLTVPNGFAQQAVVEAALQDANLQPGDLDVIEAHGTGTPLGDPIEMHALDRLFGTERDAKRPLLVGSVKAAIGHLEAAAGVAGLIKTVLAVSRATVPGQPNFTRMNPNIDLSNASIVVPSMLRPWPDRDGKPRTAGVSSFGINGTNAHVIVTEPPPSPPTPVSPRYCHILTLGARHEDALSELVELTLEALRRTDTDFADFCYTSNVGRAALPYRQAVVATNAAEAAAHLAPLLDKTSVPQPAPGPPAILLRLGAQPQPSMVADLRRQHVVFDEALGRCEAIVLRFTGTDLAADPADNPMRSFALAYGLATMWGSWLGTPHAIEASGTGLLAAGCIAGMFDLEHGLGLAGGQAKPTMTFQRPTLALICRETGHSPPDDFQFWNDLRHRRITATTASAVGRERPVEAWPAHTDPRALCDALAAIYREGAIVDWSAFHAGQARRKVDFPTTPFHRQRHWVDATAVRSPPTPAFYDVQWTPSSVAAARRETALFALNATDDIAIQAARTLAAKLNEAGQEAVLLPADAAGRAQCLTRWRGRPLTVVHFAVVESGADPVADMPARLDAVAALATQLQSGWPSRAALWLVTAAALDVAGRRAPDDLGGSALWGLSRSIRAESQNLDVTLVDLDASDRAAALNALALDLLAVPDEDEIAYAGGQRYCPRLASLQTPAWNDIPIATDGTYFVTGGLGGLGRRIALWLAAQGAGRLVLAGRSANRRDPRTARFIRRLASVCDVAVEALDVTNQAEVDACIARIDVGPYPLRGVFHAAGVLDDGVVEHLTADRLATVLGPKALGAWYLHHATRHRPLDCFVLFSSAAATLGSPGQGGYAAANAMLDALAATRRRDGLAALSIGWGPWRETGMTGRLTERDRRRMEAKGMTALAPGPAGRLMGPLLRMPVAAVVVLAVDWSRFTADLKADVPSMLRDVAPPAHDSSHAATTNGDAHRLQLQGMAAYLGTCFADAMGVPSVAPDANLFDRGLDSLTVIQVAKQLKAQLGLIVYPREIYAHPTLSALACYLTTAFAAAPTPSGAAEAAGPKVAFILSAPRSGSTLLRVMLAGHHRLFSPPELHLLPFADMRARRTALTGSYLDEGLNRALAALTGEDAETSAGRIDRMMAENWPTERVYDQLSELAGDRMLIDKSPSYGKDLATLQRAAERFGGRAKYIHLVRHPQAMIESFVRMRMDRLISTVDPRPSTEIAQDIWQRVNRNISDFRASVAPGSYMLVRYEDLVADPERTTRAICDFLEIPFDPAVLFPYRGDRMTDGVTPDSLPIGDPNFLSHNEIDPSLAWQWQQRPAIPLSAKSVDLAERLGYRAPNGGGEPSTMREHVVSLNGLESCVCTWGSDDGATAPVALCLHGLLDQGAAWAMVAEPLAALGWRVVAPDLRGHGHSSSQPPGSEYHLLDFAADADALLETISAPAVVLVGHSMGALIAKLLAAARPSRIGGLLLLEPPGRTPRAAGESLRPILDRVRRVPPPSRPLASVEEAASRLRQLTPSLTETAALSLARRATRSVEGGVRWRHDERLAARAIFDVALADLLDGTNGYPGSTVTAYGSESAIRARDRQDSNPVVELTGGHNLHLDNAKAVSELIRGLVGN